MTEFNYIQIRTVANLPSRCYASAGRRAQMIQLPIYTCKIAFTAKNPEKLPHLPFSTFRGAFGRALRSISCVLKGTKECRKCPLKESCAYGYLFETPRPHWAQKLRKYPYVPHPFVFSLPYPLKGKSEFTVTFTLFGEAVKFTPYVIMAIQTMGSNGIGKDRCKLHINSIQDASSGRELLKSGEIFYPEELKAPNIKYKNSIELTFETPTTLRFNRRYIKPSELEFHILIRNLLRRLSALSYFHTGKELQLDFKRIIELSQEVKITHKNLHTIKTSRYSKRQKTKYKMEGFIGQVKFEGELSEFSEILWIGQHTHVGKYTSFGFGKYTVNPLH